MVQLVDEPADAEENGQDTLELPTAMGTRFTGNDFLPILTKKKKIKKKKKKKTNKKQK